MDPAGGYAIPLLVKNGSVTLAWLLRNLGDRSLAGIKARGVVSGGVKQRPSTSKVVRATLPFGLPGFFGK